MIPKQHLYTQLSHQGSLLFSHSVMSNSLQLCGLQHARLPCPSSSLSLLKLMSIELMMLSNHPILCRLGGNRHVEWCVVSRLYLSHALSQKATEGCAQSKREVKAITRRKRILRTSIVIQRLKVYYAPKAGGPASHPRSCMPELKILMLQLKVPHVTTKSQRSLRQQLRPSSAE